MQEKREREGEDFVQIEQKNGREEKHSSQSTTSLFFTERVYTRTPRRKCDA